MPIVDVALPVIVFLAMVAVGLDLTPAHFARVGQQPALVGAGVLAPAVLLPVLAYMQYRWVGQVSEGERERMQRNLETAAGQFRAEFDAELGQAIRDLQVSTTAAREGSSNNYSLRYASWLKSADHPQIIADIYVVDAEGDNLRLRRFNSVTHTFDPSLWPEVIDRLRPEFEGALAASRKMLAPDPNRFARADESLIVLGLQNFGGPAPTPGSPIPRPTPSR